MSRKPIIQWLQAKLLSFILEKETITAIIVGRAFRNENRVMLIQY